PGVESVARAPARSAPARGAAAASAGADRRDGDLQAVGSRPDRAISRQAQGSEGRPGKKKGAAAGAERARARGGDALAAARGVLAAPAREPDDLVLDEPLQRVPGQGPGARAGG